MPIVINEIEISVTVTGDSQAANPTSEDHSLRENIIKECVEQVMEILNQKNDR